MAIRPPLGWSYLWCSLRTGSFGCYFLYFYMHHRDQQKKEAHYLAAVLCGRMLSELVQRSMIESESATFYRREIEKCQQYISLVQAEATRVWEAPSKPQQLPNIEDLQFFHSEFCLKTKLLHLQQQHPEEKAKPQLSRNNPIRGSMRQRTSSTSVFAWSQHRYSTPKQLNQAKPTQQKGSRQFSLQKLAPSEREAIRQSEKELREALLSAPHQGSKDSRRAYRKMARRERPIQGDAGIPVLVQIAYNIGEQSKIRSLQKKQCLPKLEPTRKKLQKMQSMGGKGQTNGRRLVISQYQPHRAQITVNSWRKLNEMIEAKQTDTPSHAHQFTNIHYYTETTTL